MGKAKIAKTKERLRESASVTAETIERIEQVIVILPEGYAHTTAQEALATLERLLEAIEREWEDTLPPRDGPEE